MDTAKYSAALTDEKANLERELSRLARVNPSNPADLQTTYSDPNEPGANASEKEADPADAGERIEDYETRNAVEVQLESRMLEVNAALERIKTGTYGMCENGDGDTHPIEEGRLDANPAARTCTAHMQ